MHLWAAAVGDRRTHRSTLTTALQEAAEPFQLLEPAPSWVLDRSPHLVAVGVHTTAEAAAPRKYVHADERATTFFSGLPVDPTGSVQAHRAARLADSWEDLPDRLEGRFCLVRIPAAGDRLDLLLDPLGLEQVFVADVDGTTLVANNLRLLERAAGLSGLDPLGLSLLLTIGWAAGDRTLRAGVRVLPGGRRTSFGTDHRREPSSVHFPTADLATHQSRRLRPEVARRLADDLVAGARALGRGFERLDCPLTGGLDSRLVAAVALAAGGETGFYTIGTEDSSDVVTARALTEALGLAHRVVLASDDAVVGTWRDSVRRHLAATDGLVSLKDRGTGPVPTRHLGVHLHGFGGEIARSFYAGPKQVIELRRPRAVDALTDGWVSTHGGIVSPVARERARDHVRTWVRDWRERGVREQDLPDLFYAFARMPRVAGANLRRRQDRADEVPLLCSRAFVETAFSLRALSRCCEPLHHELTRLLSPQLHALPLSRPQQWRPQSPTVLLAQTAVRRARRRVGRSPGPAPTGTLGLSKDRWVEACLDDIRTVCLDVTDPVFVEAVDRSTLERLLAPSTPAAHRRPHWRAILALTTAAEYAGR